MKKDFFRAIVGLLIFASFSLAFERIPFLEYFTNTSCGYCPPCDVMVKTQEGLHGSALTINLIHVWWPASSDPFYLYSPPICSTFQSRYGIDGVPAVCIDGKKLTSWSTAPTEITNRRSSSAPIDISISVGANIDVTVEVETPVTTGNNKLFVAITQSGLYYPGANGVNWHDNIMRVVLPNRNGQSIDLSRVGTQNFSFPYTWDHSVWDSVGMKIIAWVQNWSGATTTYNIHNSRWINWPMDYRFDYNPGITSAATRRDTMVVLGGGLLRNSGLLTDTYKIRLRKNLPPGWDASFCSGSSCFPDSGNVTLDPGDTTTITVDFFTMGDGMGSVQLIIKSASTERADTFSYSVIQNPSILLVDDDAGDDIESFYLTTLANLGEIPYMVSRAEGELSASDLLPYQIVIWFTGVDYGSVVTRTDTSAIGAYLDSGGKLLMSSQDLGWFCIEGLATPWRNFYQGRFKASYNEDDAGSRSVSGVDGTPFEGFISTIFSGTGADFTPYPDDIDAFGDGILAMRYVGSGEPGAAIIYSGVYRLVYFAFPWEAISTQEGRDTLMAKALRYLRGGEWIDEAPILPETPIILSSAPNPFNPATELSFEIKSPKNIKLEIFDIAGRKVATIADKKLDAGIHRFVWNGKSDAMDELPSGVYMARLSAGDKTITKKLLLAK